MTENLLAVESVDRSFGDLSVLSGVSFAADRGEAVAVVGPNGSGKTTLLRVLAGLLAPSGGTVSVATDVERPVGYLPQTPAFRPGFTVAETLDYYADLLSTPVDIAAALDRVGLAAVADRRVEALSGGMTRLLGVAQATLGSPPLVVLDEPSSGLDPTMTDRVSDVVAGVADDDATVVYSSHDLPAVERVADAVVVLDRGEVVARGSPAELTAAADAGSFPDAVAAHLGRGEEETLRTVTGGDR